MSFVELATRNAPPTDSMVAYTVGSFNFSRNIILLYVVGYIIVLCFKDILNSIQLQGILLPH